MRIITIGLVAAMATAAHADTRVVVMTERADADALKVALAGLGTELVAQPMPEGGLRLERAAAAQRIALDQHASAAVWVDQEPGSAEVCVVSADGHVFRHAPLPVAEGSPRVFAAIATSLLDDLLAPVVVTPAVKVTVDVAGTPAPAPPVVFVPPTPTAVLVQPTQLPTVAPVAPQVDAPVRSVPSAPRTASTLTLAAGPFVASRGMLFDYDPGNLAGGPPDYPRQTLQGVQASVSYFPRAFESPGRRGSGFGIEAAVSRSVRSVLTSQDETGYGDSELDRTTWDFEVAYRYPHNDLHFQGELGVGGNATKIIDLPETVAIPDTDYKYLTAGARVGIDVGETSLVELGARYMHLVSAGDVTDQSWYGAGSANGYAADASLLVPRLFRGFGLKLAAEYQQQKIDFEGSGELAMDSAVWSVVDSTVSGSASIVAQF